MTRSGTGTGMRMGKKGELAGFAGWAWLYRDVMGGRGMQGMSLVSRPARIEGILSVPVAVTGGGGEAREQQTTEAKRK